MKIGHISTMDVISRMPETDSAQRALQDYGKEFEDNLTLMQTELQNKYAEFQNNQNQWSDLIKQTKQRELEDMQVRMQEFYQQGQEDYNRKQQELLNPITEKVTKAIEEVAKDGKFSYILDSSNGTVFIGPESIDVTSLVEAKLGLSGRAGAAIHLPQACGACGGFETNEIISGSEKDYCDRRDRVYRVPYGGGVAAEGVRCDCGG